MAWCRILFVMTVASAQCFQEFAPSNMLPYPSDHQLEGTLNHAQCTLKCIERYDNDSIVHKTINSGYSNWTYFAIDDSYGCNSSESEVYFCAKGCMFEFFQQTSDHSTSSCNGQCEGQANFKQPLLGSVKDYRLDSGLRTEPTVEPFSQCIYWPTFSQDAVIQSCLNPGCFSSCSYIYSCSDTGSSACLTGCTIETPIFNDTTSRPPSPPILTQVESQTSLEFSIDLSDTEMHSLMVNHTSQLVGFVFKIAVKNEEYFWFQLNPEHNLDFQAFGCDVINVSFAVVSKEGWSGFSDAILLSFNGIEIVQNFALNHTLSRTGNTLFLQANATFDVTLRDLQNLYVFVCVGAIPLLQQPYNERMLSDVSGCARILTSYNDSDAVMVSHLTTVEVSDDTQYIYMQVIPDISPTPARVMEPHSIPLQQASPTNLPTLSTSSLATSKEPILSSAEITGVVLCCLIVIGVAMLMGVIGLFCATKKRKIARLTKDAASLPLSGTLRLPISNMTQLQSIAKLAYPPDDWELHPSDIIMGKMLGEGAFGQVYIGFLTEHGKSSKVQCKSTTIAIKILKGNARGCEKKDFLSEIEMMKKVSANHCPNIVVMLGCVMTREPLCLVTEFIKHGDLLSYLRAIRKRHVSGNTMMEDDPYVNLGQVKPADLTSFAYQIAKGMSYLSGIGIVHRDLACRNILVDEGKVLKITDFGLSRETKEIYTQSSHVRVPFKWMAIESIVAREFTSATDVWSYGVVLWEIGTLVSLRPLIQEILDKICQGGFPYPGVTNKELLPLLKSGCRMEKPDNCSPEIYDIMLSCWDASTDKRPTFLVLLSKFESLLSEEGNPYIDFTINPEMQCYNEEEAESDEEDFAEDTASVFSGGDQRSSRISAGSQEGNDPQDVSLTGEKSSLFHTLLKKEAPGSNDASPLHHDVKFDMRYVDNPSGASIKVEEAAL